MELFWKATAGILISAILCMSVKEKDYSILLTLAVVCMTGAVVIHFIEPIIDLLWEMAALAAIQDGILGILLKSTGIAFVTELAGMVCRDTGNNSLEKILQMLGFSAILYLSIPVFQSLLRVLQEVLGE